MTFRDQIDLLITNLLSLTVFDKSETVNIFETYIQETNYSVELSFDLKQRIRKICFGKNDIRTPGGIRFPDYNRDRHLKDKKSSKQNPMQENVGG